MSNKYIQENANEYYRPSLDDDDIDFFPSQGMLPIYHFKNGFLVKAEINNKELIELENDNLNEKRENNDSLYLYSLIFFLLLFFSTKNTFFKKLIHKFFTF